MSHTILIAEDDPLQRKMAVALLAKRLGYTVVEASNGKEALTRIQESAVGEISAVLLDIQMPVMDGFETLQAIRKYRPDVPVIMLTGVEDTATAVRSIKEGASDFVNKPADAASLDRAIHNAIRLSSLSRELHKMKRDKEGALSFSDIVGHRTGLAEAVALGRKAAALNVPVLLIGESGVGKEFFARAIHGDSKRMGAAFVTINCSAIPEHLVDNVLFSQEKGALRRAEGGTLFLDDIDKLPQEAQVRLLRLLHYHDIEPTGVGKSIKVNVRIIAATERDLIRDVREGRFREDLYFRLSVLPIRLIPLRERPQDILPIAEYFITRLSASEGILTKTLSKEAIQYLMAQHWSGNVRELENVIHRALVMADEEVIDEPLLAHIHHASAPLQPVERRAAPALHVNLRDPQGAFKPMEAIEAEVLRMALAFYEDHVGNAADALHIAKSTFYRKLKHLS